jgi:hypothetical protein
MFIDALDLPDDKLAYKLAVGFPVLHNIPDSGVYRRITSDMDDAQFQRVYDKTMTENRE